jgi:phosphoglycolate phosphatase
MLESYGAPPRPIDDVAGMVGEGAKKLVQRALSASGLDPAEPDALDRFLAIYDRRLLRHTLPYAGIPDVLRAAAARAPLAVLSNKPEAPTRRLLDAFELTGFFAWIVGGDSSFPRKPDPSSLQYLMRAAGVTPESTLFVGDSMIDVETARAAGVRMSVVLYGFGGLRGDLVLTPSEATAPDVPALEAAIDGFLAGLSG